MGLSQFLRRKTAWAIAVYFQDRLALPPEGRPDRLLLSKKLFRGPRHVHTRADPFLFVENGKLFLLYETQVLDDPGRIEAAEITPSGLRAIGTVLHEPFHLSYPAVFRRFDGLYLLPECQASGGMRLYRFTEFPGEAVYVRTLLDGAFADPSPVMVGETLFIFATTTRGLELYFMDDLLSGELRPHPDNPISNDPGVYRCGGLPFMLEGHLMRPAQNCSRSYGGNLSLMRINVLTKEAYREEPHQSDIFNGQYRWNSEGGHHVSVASYGDGVAIAVDGQAYDHYIHKLITRAWLIATRGRQQ